MNYAWPLGGKFWLHRLLLKKRVGDPSRCSLCHDMPSNGLEALWRLDVDIFVVQNPTARLLDLAQTADVLTTDHFDESLAMSGREVRYSQVVAGLHIPERCDEGMPQSRRHLREGMDRAHSENLTCSACCCFGLAQNCLSCRPPTGLSAGC